jgi:hypothetical protein
MNVFTVEFITEYNFGRLKREFFSFDQAYDIFLRICVLMTKLLVQLIQLRNVQICQRHAEPKHE